jgi:hypothetical protein
LVGNTLWSFSDVWAYAKGDPPTVSASINKFHFFLSTLYSLVK